MNNINSKYFTNSLLNEEYINALKRKLEQKGYTLGGDYSDRARDEEISTFVNEYIEKFIVIQGEQKEQKKIKKWLRQIAAQPLGRHLLEKLSGQIKEKKITLELGGESITHYYTLKITLKDGDNYGEFISLKDGIEIQKKKMHVTMAHELIHLYHHLKAPRKRGGRYEKKVSHHFCDLEELRTITGLNDFSSEKISSVLCENAFNLMGLQSKVRLNHQGVDQPKGTEKNPNIYAQLPHGLPYLLREVSEKGCQVLNRTYPYCQGGNNTPEERPLTVALERHPEIAEKLLDHSELEVNYPNGPIKTALLRRQFTLAEKICRHPTFGGANGSLVVLALKYQQFSIARNLIEHPSFTVNREEEEKLLHHLTTRKIEPEEKSIFQLLNLKGHITAHPLILAMIHGDLGEATEYVQDPTFSINETKEGSFLIIAYQLGYYGLAKDMVRHPRFNAELHEVNKCISDYFYYISSTTKTCQTSRLKKLFYDTFFSQRTTSPTEVMKELVKALSEEKFAELLREHVLNQQKRDWILAYARDRCTEKLVNGLIEKNQEHEELVGELNLLLYEVGK